jgi:hypothetical protein
MQKNRHRPSQDYVRTGPKQATTPTLETAYKYTYCLHFTRKNAIYAHAQDVAASDELLLAILKTFITQSLNKQQTIGFRVF